MIILANLDCETEMIRLRRGAEPRPLSGRVLKRVSALGTLLRIFAEEGDELLLPESVPAACMRPIAGVQEPALKARREVPPDSVRLAWCHVSASAAECNERAFAFQIARRLGCLLPGSQLIATKEQLAGARFPRSPWLFKAGLSVAGRDRVRSSGGAATPDQSRRIERLLQEQGPGVLEPWMSRTLDLGFGSQEGAHIIEGTEGGAFQGIRRPAPSLDASERRDIALVREEVGRALAARGHTGPWGVDAWCYRRPDGTLGFQALGEVNARMTFGHVARAWFERVGVPRWGTDTPLALRFGERAETDEEACISLLGDPDLPISYAWLERLKPGAS